MLNNNGKWTHRHTPGFLVPMMILALTFPSIKEINAASITINNPGFENDKKGWSTASGISVSKSDVKSGSKSLKVSGKGNESTQTLTGLSPDTDYVFKAWVLGDGGIGVRDFGGTEAFMEVEGRAFQQVEVPFKTGKSSTSATIFIKDTTISGDVRFDDLEMETIDAKKAANLAKSNKAKMEAMLAARAAIPVVKVFKAPKTAAKPLAQRKFPADLLDLTEWKITLPWDGPDENPWADEIKQPELKTAENAPWFTLNPEKDGVLFRSRADGVRTSANTKYARSELREMTNNGTIPAAWSINDTTMHRMFIKQKITRVTPQKPHVSIGQIHNGDDQVMIRYEGAGSREKSTTGTLYCFLNNSKDSFVLEKGHKVGTVFTVEIRAQNGKVTVLYNGKPTEITDKVIKNPEGCYFKAGMYIQSNAWNTSKYGGPYLDEAPEEYSELCIYELIVD